MTSGFVAGMYQSSLPPGYQVAERPPWPWPCGGRFIVRENKPRRDYGTFFAFLLLFFAPADSTPANNGAGSSESNESYCLGSWNWRVHRIPEQKERDEAGKNDRGRLGEADLVRLKRKRQKRESYLKFASKGKGFAEYPARRGKEPTSPGRDPAEQTPELDG